jgi:acetyl-CoA acyltransferase
MCVGLGMGGTVIWENPHWTGTNENETDTAGSAA